ncbi:MAG: hypothetical protein A7315_02465 [Candidatus Altiarchaeales archaeon WOR_SM1_79]|nr:MAG: hypothetical protein A7315_02465 [Candidatus Altiarchaeales archaeon WOR_SM1_79]
MICTGSKKPTILVIATLDTKEEEAKFLKEEIESKGCNTLVMDSGILSTPTMKPDITQYEVAEAGGISIEELVASKDKGKCIHTMIKGVKKLSKELFDKGRFQGVISIGGAQGTDIGTAAMRVLPFGVPKFMVSTVASGLATFGTYVGTKDIVMMHSVADMQGLNKITTKVLVNAASAICGMVKGLYSAKSSIGERRSVAMSMLGTTTPGALRAKVILEEKGFEVVAFHQNGTGGIAMEDMILEGAFQGVLDINLHELGDYVVKGLHGAIREYRLESAGKMRIPQVIAPGSINYTVQGPFQSLPEELKKRKYIIHNPNLTLVRLSHEELEEVGKLTARKLNMAKGPIHIFIPLRGFSYPDREGLPHWDPEANLLFINTLREELDPSIPLEEIDAHINDKEFIDPVVDQFLSFIMI